MSANKARHVRKAHLLASVLVNTDAVRLVKVLRGSDCLTVLAYNRIAEIESPRYAYYKPNVSATPEMFAKQMKYVSEHFNVITLETLNAHIQNGNLLPQNSLLITFDDGYLDNYQHAFPVLRAYNLPAVMFLVTSRMTNPSPLWWDDIAYRFFHSDQRKVTIPYIGEFHLSSHGQREAACNTFIQQVKYLPDNLRDIAFRSIHECLPIDMSDQGPQFVSWDQVRKLSSSGISCQPHTVTHPILSRIPIGQIYWEIRQSSEDVERETGIKPIAFAYPNGHDADFNHETIDAVAENKFCMAFTSHSGTIHKDQISQCRYTLPRIHIGYRDTFEIFVMKLTGTRQLAKSATRAQ
jgi:peptidoglycan/xylan/chitin deacetylase (PgdA/CDA1 family)